MTNTAPTIPWPNLRIRDLLLWALTVSSGAIDAVSFLALGKVFTAFMTGNIAFYGLRVAGVPGPGFVAILASLLAFAGGVVLSTRIVKRAPLVGPWPRPVTIALAVSLPFHLAFAIVWAACHAQPSVNMTHVLLGLWALPMGMQSAAVRRLQVDGVFTTAATATIVILVGDLAGSPAKPGEMRRLAGVLAALFLGAISGSLFLVHAPVSAPLLPFVITFGVVATAWFALPESVAPARLDDGSERPSARPSVGGGAGGGWFDREAARHLGAPEDLHGGVTS